MAKKILDLKVLSQQDTFDVTLPNDDILNLNKPSEKLLIEFMSFEDKASELHGLPPIERSKSMISMQKEMVRGILSCNRNGIQIDDEFFEMHGLDFYMQQAIVQAYAEYVQELSRDPNFKSPLNQV